MNLSSSTRPGLVLVHGNRAESLRDLLLAWVKAHPLLPLEREVILVQSNGMGQWLKLALAADPMAGGDSVADAAEGGCGIAASLEFALPSTFIWHCYRTLLGHAAVPETSPLDKSALVWRLFRLLPEIMRDTEQQSLYAPLARFLTGDVDGRKRYQLAEQIADLYDQYQVYRADWLAAWSAAADVFIDAKGKRHDLDADSRWQSALWRRIRQDVERQSMPAGAQTLVQPLAQTLAQSLAQTLAQTLGRADVHQAFMQRVQVLAAAGQRPQGLRRRLLVFGISTLPRQSMEVLQALSRWVQVFVFVQNPCQHYWADSVSGRELLRQASARQRRKPGHDQVLDEDALRGNAHPLLAAWGKQGRDFIALLDEMDDEQARQIHRQWLSALHKSIDLFESPLDDARWASAGQPLLAQIQADILDLRSEREIAEHKRLLQPQDQSIRFHIAHSPQREVEILQDQLLEAFASDPSLRPRDLLVMVPDIAAYAPSIQAVFGLHAPSQEARDKRFIPFSIADQNPRQLNPLLNALQALLGLAQSRLKLGEVFDFLQLPAMRQRLGLNEADLAPLRSWVAQAKVRWGLHAEHHRQLGLPGQGLPGQGLAEQEAVAAHSWLFGLRRLLLGYASGASASPWQGIEPYANLGGVAAARLGPLIEFLSRLEKTWRDLQQPRSPDDWVKRLRALLKDFFLAQTAQDSYSLLQLEEALQDWQLTCAEVGLQEPLPLSIVAEAWLARFEEPGLGQRFFAGCVIFATLMPMRAIPFRRVYLLGMQDGAYPRSRKPVDFDLMARDYRPGDRSRREDDRYLFLEALLAAREGLSISWVGRSITDNSERPPSVLVAQLRDHLRSGWILPTESDVGQGLDRGTAEQGRAGEQLLAALTLEHPLQPFSPKYLQAQTRYFTYAREWFAATEPQPGGPSGQPASQPAGQPAPLPALERQEPLSLDELIGFLKSPIKAFMQRRLGIGFQQDEVEEEIEPFQPDGLAAWALKDELIQGLVQALDGQADPRDVEAASIQRWQRRGDLPPGAFADLLVQDLTAGLADWKQAYGQAIGQWPQRLDILPFEWIYQPAQAGAGLRLQDQLRGLRRGEDGGLAWIGYSASELVKDNKYRIEKVLPHWVRHLAFHLALNQPLTSQVLSLKGNIRLGPLGPDEARACFEALVQAWHLGMQRPLPIEMKTALAWLKAGGSAEPSKADAAARQVYEPGYQTPGEVGRCPYLRRAYPDYASLSASGEFASLAEQLLRPLLKAVHDKAES